MNNTDSIEGEIFLCSNSRKSLWATSNNYIIYSTREKEHNFVYKQDIIIKNSLLTDIQLADIDENIPDLVKALLGQYDLKSIDINHINSSSINNNFKIITGRLCISSKTRWGITNKGLTKYTFKPRDHSYPTYIVASKLKPSQIDIYVKIEIDVWDKNSEHPRGIFVETLGPVTNTDIYENTIISSHLVLPRNRNSTIRSESKIFQHSIDYNSKEDWIDVPITISIDPKGCTDIDDVLSIREFKNKIEFAVHIANPVIWFDYLSKTNLLSQSQTTTLYTSKNIYHLIPPILSTNKASLLENQERHCISVIWTIENDIISKRITTTKIINKKAFSYDEFDSQNNYRIIYDTFAKIWNYTPIDSHELIEKSMIYTNQYVAEYLVLHIKNNTLLRKTIDQSAWYLLYNENNNNSHDFIGSELYTHFTSPIRRYCDQYVHRQILSIIDDYPQHLIDINTIIRMNTVKYKTKIIDSELNWFNIAIPNDSIILKGKLLYVFDQYARVDITLPIDNKISIPLISYKIADLIDISYDNNKLTLHFKNTDKKIKFDIEEITVKLYWISSKGLEGFNFEWIDPPISNWLNQ